MAFKTLHAVEASWFSSTVHLVNNDIGYGQGFVMHKSRHRQCESVGEHAALVQTHMLRLKEYVG